MRPALALLIIRRQTRNGRKIVEKVALPHDVWVLVGDGRKALVLRNHGDATYPDLRPVSVLRDESNPSTASQGTDRPGRSIDHATGRRSGVEQTDWHELGEQRFVQSVAAQLSGREKDIAALVVVAPPRTLSELRSAFSDGLRKKVVAEVTKDLTHHPVHEIERLLTGHPRK
jgi:protein required for attachment to host cells